MALGVKAIDRHSAHDTVDLVCRWGGAVLAEAEKRVDRVKGSRQMPLVLKGVKELIDRQQAVV